WKFDQAVTDPAAASHQQITPHPSTGVHDERGWRNRRRTTRSARARAAAGSPYEKLRSDTTLPPTASWSTGAPGAMATTGEAATGSGSYSTATSSAASSATYRSRATTTATGSPTYRTRSTAAA